MTSLSPNQNDGTVATASIQRENNDDDDDDMADLFSFASSSEIVPTVTSSSGNSSSNDIPSNNNNHDDDHGTMNQNRSNTRTTTTNDPGASSSSSLFASLPAFLSQRLQQQQQQSSLTNQTKEPDAFLELLDAAVTTSSSSSSASSSHGNHSSRNTTTSATTTDPPLLLDAATLEILDWLDQDDDDGNHVVGSSSSGGTSDDPSRNQNNDNTPVDSTPPLVPTTTASTTASTVTTPPTPTVVALPPVFTTWHDALWSPVSTTTQIRDLLLLLLLEDDDDQDWTAVVPNNNNKNDDDDAAATTTPSPPQQQQQQQQQPHRAQLYCRMICHNKSLETILRGSLADSFDQWRRQQPPTPCTTEATTVTNQNNNNTPPPAWISPLALRIASRTGRSVADCTTDLIQLVNYHQQSSSSNSNSSPPSSSATTTPPPHDPLLPMVAATVLSADLPVPAAAVVLAQIIPSQMPLLRLPPATERWEAALFLHAECYYLCAYHIPLLVHHLDRHLPGWYWPKLVHDDHDDDENDENRDSAVRIGRNLTKQGQIPISWLVSHLSGECHGGDDNKNDDNRSDTASSSWLPMDIVIRLWDMIILTGGPAPIRFFLTLAVLERQAATLLLLTGSELRHAVQNLWSLHNIDEHKEPNEREWKYEWWPQALLLQSSTPESVLDRLQKVEDEAVQHALVRKQERAEALLRERLEAEALAHREAQELKAEEARIRLSRARLVAFYRKHAPDKESNIEQIMETYNGRLDVLDMKLKSKYGEGFNPAVKAKPPPPPKTNLLAKMNQRMKWSKSGIDEDVLDSAMEERKPSQVSVFVTAAEVLPVICWSKEATAARGIDESRRRKANQKRRKALKFYLIDCRTELAAQEQGRFPTAFHLSPETLQDPEKLQEHEETFESFRGAVHIVIMGEGFNAIPSLYNQKLSPKLQELMEQDESRTNLCALFFQKRGFCFVSLLTGGFCAAHSWLVRDGAKHHLNVSSVLVDYHPENTLFGQLETLHNASMTEKAQRKMANLLEASMTTVTKRAIQLERLTAELNDGKDGQRQGFRKLFGRADALSTPNVLQDVVENIGPVATPTSGSSMEKARPSTAQAKVKADGPLVEPLPIESVEADESSLLDALAAPSAEVPSSTELIPPSTLPLSTITTTTDTNATNSTTNPSATVTTATNKFGKFFQQTSEAVGVAAAAAAATASSTIANSSSRNDTTGATTSTNSKTKDEISNAFKGFGAAFQQTRARFGNVATGGVSGGTATTTSESTAAATTATGPITTATITAPSTSPGSSNTGFGFNSFRKSTMSRVLQKASTMNQPQPPPPQQSTDQDNNNDNNKSLDDKEISVTFV